MGMAASQARYLSLVARKVNVEYEGQQINQSRTALANQSANLFNQMLGLQVPVPPSVQNFTKLQYSFTDGINGSVIDKWEQLAVPDDEGNNYVVEYHYDANVYTGYQKKMNDPQIQFTSYTPVYPEDSKARENAEKVDIQRIQQKQTAVTAAQKAYDEAKAAYEKEVARGKSLATYRDSNTWYQQAKVTDHTNSAYSIWKKSDKSDTSPTTFYSYNSLGEAATVGNCTYWADKDGYLYSEYKSGLTTAVKAGTQIYYDDKGLLTINASREVERATEPGIFDKISNTPADTGLSVYADANNKLTKNATYSTTNTVNNDAVEKTSLFKDADGNIYTENADGRNPLADGDSVYKTADGTFTINATSGTGDDAVDNTPVANIYIDGEGNLTTDATRTEDVDGNNTRVYIGGDEETAKEYKLALQDYLRTWTADGIEPNLGSLYYDPVNKQIAFSNDLENLNGVSGVLNTLFIYNVDGNATTNYETISSEQQKLSDLRTKQVNAYSELETAKQALSSENIPEYLGNTKLTALSELSKEQMAEIRQIIRDMEKNGVKDCNFTKCFSPETSISESSVNQGLTDYLGGIYSFERDGVTYYTTYYDLADTAADTEFMNPIDNQAKLNYYHANYTKQSIDTVDKAVLDTDSKGRFKTVRFASDGATYTLNVEEVTDDAAYEDAMNQYYYKSAEYDKMIQDLNARTSIIHSEDRTLELRLKQLETEQSALSSEIEAVQKVVKDDVDKSFKTFSG